MADQSQFAPPHAPRPFIGREPELEWLSERIGPYRRHFGDAISVVGEPGIGKTALVRRFLELHAEELTPIYIACREWTRDRPNFLEIFDGRSVEWRYRRGVTVIFDGAEEVPQRRFMELYRDAVNWKIVERVVVTSRKEVELRGVEQLVLTRLPEIDAEALLRAKLSLSSIDEKSALRVIAAVNGHPEALAILATLANSMSREQLQRILSGNLYDIGDVPASERRSLALAAKPVILSATDDLIQKLKREPTDIHKLTPRQYEELIAELLRDMGHEVMLTQATRDGGKDILATMKTDIGDILCLVDAKKYREDRRIGVGMVRTLYGTLADYQASSAMLVTTSSYSKDARAMQERHRYQLSLKDYTDVASWIQKYGKSGR
ncbi:AAA family ATPase [Granulicella sp. WH15]|uniref:restriction endonuclease n=1 Tax=Granulicella sp. WH15 TaxID=2602070 RepID=UPI001366A22D|nr:restriction endonuclease [Granulicella sp. WH15]QHN03423.1 AAA family ATPase [Granulicella sp. WH15]